MSQNEKQNWDKPGMDEDTRALFSQLEYLKDESDLGCILIAVSFIDLCLEKLIRASLTFSDDDVFSGANSPFAAFSNRIKIAHSFGLVGPEEKAELHRFRRIRNRAAHSPEPAKFSDPGVNDAIRQLHAKHLSGNWESVDTKQIFILATVMAAGRLQKKASIVKPMGYFPVGGLENDETVPDPLAATGSSISNGKLIQGRMWWDFASKIS